jgi:hypothetical protein
MASVASLVPPTWGLNPSGPRPHPDWTTTMVAAIAAAAAHPIDLLGIRA